MLLRCSITFLVCLWTAVSADAQTIAVNGELPPNAVTVGAATSVAIAVSDGPGNATDWIALYPVAAADSAYLGWSYLNGTSTAPASGLTSATFTTYAPPTPGDYEWRLFANDGWNRIATSSVVTVTASTAVLTVNGVPAPAEASIGAGGSMTVTLAAGPGNPTDWIGLAPVGSPDSTLVDWRYLNGTTVPPATGLNSGAVQFLAPSTAGSYEFRFFAHGTFTRVATATINVSASTAAIIVDDIAPPTAVSVVAGTHVSVGITGGPAQPGDWVGLFGANAADSANLGWRYLNGSTTIPSNGQSDAQLIFAVPVAAGSYEFRFFNANTFTRLATSTTMVVSASSAALSVNGVAAPASVTLAAGSQTVVSVNGGPANAGDWVGLYRVGEPDAAVMDWRYLNDTAQLPATGVSTSTLHFGVPTTAGTYEFRFFAEGGGLLAKSGNVVVPQTVAQISVNGVAPPTPVSVAPGSTLTVLITGGPANPTDWVALATQGAPDSSSISWQYLNGSTSPPSTGLSSATLSFVLPSAAGTYDLRLFAHNSQQRITTSSAITASTGPPQVTVSLTSPFPGTTFNAPSSVLVSASASITGATISRVDFYTGSALIGTATAPPYEASLLNPQQGTHVLRAAVVDSTDTLTTSSPVAITIAPAGAGAGTLGPPIADPPGGIYGAGQTVTLSAAHGATIRYTVDGSDPDEASVVYSEALAVTQSSTLRARAYQSDWTASEIVTATYVIDTIAPTITATVSPSANAAGWHHSTVTVTFVCADNLSVSICPSPVTVSGDGAAQLVSAAAIDSAGNAAPITVSVSLDRTAPSVDVPAELSAQVADAALSFDASITDALSGASSATCNGVASQTIGSTVTCSLTLQKGRNVIVVAARDAAGNVGSDSAIVSWIPTAEASSISVSPLSAGMIVGEDRTFSVRDDQGRLLSATWETSDPEVVDFIEGRATALAPGEATLTATASGLTATTNVVVYAGPFLPVGVARWSSPSIGGASGVADTVVLNAFGPDDASLLSIEYANPDRTQPLVRGLTVDGTELWTATLPIGSQEWIDPPIADPYGGMVAVVRDLSTFRVRGIIRASWSAGVASWRRDLPDGFDASIMQSGDGTLYVSESYVESNEFHEEAPTIYTTRHDIVGMDASTGAVRFRMTLPSFTIYQQRAGKNFQDVYVLSASDGMAVSSDGFLYSTLTSGFSNDQFPGTWARDAKLMRVNPTGEVVFEQLWQGEKTSPVPVPFQLRDGNMQSDGAGGVFFAMAVHDGTVELLHGKYRSTTFSNDFEIPNGEGAGGLFGRTLWPQVTGIDSKSISIRFGGARNFLRSFDMRSGAVHWEIEATSTEETLEQATVALEGGGAVLVDGLGGYRTINSSGATESAANLGVGAGQYAFGRFHPREVDGTLKAVPWQPLDDATAYGVGGARSGPPYGIWAKSHYVIAPYKHAALRLIPRNQSKWLATPNPWHVYFKAPKMKRYGDLVFATIGGGPSDGTGGPSAYLETRFNSMTDIEKDSVDWMERLSHSTCCFPFPIPPSAWEDFMIARLFSMADTFDDQTLDYEPTPGSSTDGYNSNSYLRGLLEAAGLVLPRFPWVYLDDSPFFPGWFKPVPAIHFGVQP